jgi:hypothetical protein
MLGVTCYEDDFLFLGLTLGSRRRVVSREVHAELPTLADARLCW